MRSHTGVRFLVPLLGTLWCQAAYAQTVVVFRHQADCKDVAKDQVCTKESRVEMKGGERLIIRVTETDKTAMVIRLHGYISAADTSPVKATGDGAPHDTISAEAVYEPRYGGYVATVQRQDGQPDHRLRNAIIIVRIEPEPKPYAFSGGIALTSIRNDPYAIRSVVDTTTSGGGEAQIDTTSTIYVDEAKRDAASVGFGTYLTVNLPRLIHRSLSFLNIAVGIGLETSGQTQYYFGLGAELHRGIFLNGGYVLGQVKVLPNGTDVGDTVTDPNVLNNLGNRSKGGAFIGMSFTFLGGGQQTFSKPFAPADGKE